LLMNRKDEAIKAFRKSVDLNPDNLAGKKILLDLLQ